MSEELARECVRCGATESLCRLHILIRHNPEDAGGDDWDDIILCMSCENKLGDLFEDFFEFCPKWKRRAQ